MERKKEKRKKKERKRKKEADKVSLVHSSAEMPTVSTDPLTDVRFSINIIHHPTNTS